MKKWVICLVVSILLIVASIVLPVNSGLSILIMIVGILAVIFSWFRILLVRGVVPDAEMGKTAGGRRYLIHLEKQDATNVWDAITEKAPDCKLEVDKGRTR